MPLRQRDTHTLTVYALTDSGETNLDGSPKQGWSEQASLTVEAFPPGTMSSTGTTRTLAGVQTEQDMVAVTTDAAADTLTGGDHAVLTRASGEADAFLVDYISALPGRYRTPEEWEIGLSLTDGTSPSDYQ